MFDFLSALWDPSVPFIRYAFVAGLLGSAAFGIIGSYVTVRRISSMAGAIAHSVLAGVGAALYVQSRFDIAWFTPTVGATVAGLVAALTIGLVSLYSKEREDTVIGAIWAVGMALGVLFIARTPGYVDPMSYLFGNILIVSRSDLTMIIWLDVLVILLGLLLYRKFQAVAFDEEFALVRGLRARFYYILLLLLAALTIVLLAQIVGIIMVIALLTIPPAVAGLFVRSLAGMMAIATLFAALFTSAGMAISYTVDLPTGSVIIVFAGTVYLLALAVRALLRRMERSTPQHEELR
ncbi:MAG: metal ABC transporter permease [Spirochaetaceae bacterium]